MTENLSSLLKCRMQCLKVKGVIRRWYGNRTSNLRNKKQGKEKEQKGEEGKAEGRDRKGKRRSPSLLPDY